MPPREFSGGGGGGGSGSGSGSGASALSPAKPDKGKGKLEVDQLDVDIALKQRIDLCVLMLQDADPGVHEHALNTLWNEIRSFKYATCSVPKPVEFLFPHLETLKSCHEKMNESVRKGKMAEIVSLVDSAVKQMVGKVALMVGTMDTEGQGEGESKEKDGASKADEGTMLMVTTWADLPQDLIISVVSTLPCCRAERQAVTSLNRHWRQVTQLHVPLPAALPWLFMPSSTAPVFHPSTSGGRWHKLNATEDFKQHAHICGSAEGGWVVLVLVEPRRHQLFNFNSGDIHSLPIDMLIDGEVRAVTLKAAVLSGSPIPPYSVAALVQLQDESLVCLALGNHLSPHWEYVAAFAEDCTIQDLLYYMDTLYLLTSDEDVLQLVIKDHEFHLRDLHVSARPGYVIDSMIYVMQRYLCESQGSLFMIVKFLTNNITLEVRAFELEINPAVLQPNWDDGNTTVDEDKQASWVDMSESKQLHGRLFFVGQASSRSFDTAEDGRIHFLDDRHVQVTPHEYSREDMVTVSFLDLMIMNFPPVGNEPLPPPTSDRDPPAWWLP